MQEENIKDDKDTAIKCLGIIMQFHDIVLNEEQAKHSIGKYEDINEIDIVTIAKNMNLKSKIADIKYDKLEKMVLPAIAKLNDNTYIIIAKADKEKILALFPDKHAPTIIKKDEFTKIYSGKIILFTKRYFTKSDVIFGIKWFIPDIIKYKKPLSQVLLAAFTMQVLGLFTPMMMQVVIDKVLVNGSYSKINVLAL